MSPPGGYGPRGSFQNTVPSNYAALPSSGVRPAPRDDVRGMHDCLAEGLVTGVLDLRLQTVDPLRVGSGVAQPLTAGNKDVIAQDIVLRDYAPVVPGASLKGVVRSHFEVLAGGCALAPDCDPPCVACSLFGQIRKQGQLMGRVGFSDAELEDPSHADACVTLMNLPRAFQPRKSVGRRVYGPPAASLPSEVPTIVVKAGTVFRGQVQLVNVRPWELGVALLACGVDGTFLPRFGGGKFAGLGRIRVTVTKARMRAGYRVPRPEILEGAPLEAAVKQWLAAAELGNGGEEALKTLRKVLGSWGKT